MHYYIPYPISLYNPDSISPDHLRSFNIWKSCTTGFQRGHYLTSFFRFNLLIFRFFNRNNIRGSVNPIPFKNKREKITTVGNIFLDCVKLKIVQWFLYVLFERIFGSNILGYFGNNKKEQQQYYFNIYTK